MIGLRSLFGGLCLAAVVSCSVPTDTAVRDIASKNVPHSLMATSTSSTSISTSTTIAAPPSTAAATVPPTTALDPTVDTVYLYFVAGDRFVQERRLLRSSGSLAVVVAALVLGPSSPDGFAVARSAVGFDDVKSIDSAAGIVTVELDPRVRDLPTAEQRRLVGQLVLTLTSQRGVGQVRFTVDGRAIDVPDGEGSFSSALSQDAYSGLVVEAIPSTLPFTIPPRPGESGPGQTDPADPADSDPAEPGV